MDPVSLTLGILPLLGGAIKAYGALYKKLKIFRHYSREVHRVRKHLDRQRQFFRNETHLLIRPALEEWTVECMLEDASHAKWHSKELEAALRSLLGKNYDACLDIIDEIGGVVDELQREMGCFDEVEAQRQKGESLRDTLRRLGGRLKITWDKSKFESSITNLRNSNDDLRRLREQASELRKPKTPLKETQKRLGQEYSDYGTIRRASKALHLALTTAWSKPATSCPSAGLRHNVKLFVDAKVKDGVHMDMAVLCYGHESATVNLMRPNLTRFQVRSQVIDWMESGLNTPPRSDDGHQKRRKVRFMDDCTASKDPGSTAASAMLQTPEGSDTQSTQSTQSDDLSGKDICSTLTQERLNPATRSSSGCLGFIDTCCQETFRHSLYQGIGQQRLQPQRLVSMSQALSNSAENLLTVVDQLRLARNLVAAVLKFHSTPWLGQYFALNDLSFFQTGPELPACLQTLHFGTDFITKEGVELEPTPMEGLESTTNASTFMMAAFEKAKLQYGIRNLTLWSLGAILLQIGRWFKIDSPDDVLTIRRLSSQTPALGPRYQELTKRCLECDFGYGEDLSKPRLQQAVYENLVCELNDMIKSLDISA